MFDYDKNQLSGQKSQIGQRTAELIAVVLGQAIHHFEDNGEKACIIAGAAIPSLAGLAVLMGRHPGNPGDMVQPKPDDVTFGACYMIACVEGHSDGIIAGFSLHIVEKAQILFKSIMGREYPLQPNLVEMIAKLNSDVEAATPEPFKRFLPN